MVYDLQVSELVVEVRLKKIKNFHLSVHPPAGKVTMSAPLETDAEKIRVYLLTKLTWIRKQQQKIKHQPRQNEYHFVPRESHYLFGERYLLKISEDNISFKNAAVKKRQKQLELHIPLGADFKAKQEILNSFYRTELHDYLKKQMKAWAMKMNVDEPKFGIRSMKTKWGSCNTEKKTLLFNAELAKKPKRCIDYVIVHEMVHLLVRHHNQEFILLMDKFLPEWRLRKKILNDLPV